MSTRKRNPLVSIVIPTYRNRGNLTNAIESALNQTYTNIEVIIVDDNGIGTEYQKETEVLVQKYLLTSKVLYIPHEINRNGAAARNTGIYHSNGEYIAFLDDDDCYLPEKICLQVEFLGKHPNYDAVYTQCEANGCIIAENLKDGNLTKELLLLQTHMYTPSLMFTAESLKSIGGFDETFRRHQDYEIMLRFFDAGFMIGAINDPLTIIGANKGENTLKGHALENLKIKYLSKFADIIEEKSINDRQFKNKVYSRHYADVFLGYVKIFDMVNAFRIFITNCPKSPKLFLTHITGSLKNKLKSYNVL